MPKIGYLIMSSLVLAIGFAVPDVTQSDWELSECIENCRIAFDPDKAMADYSDCVENCKRKFPQ
jgi:hypothetical protein